MSLDECFIVYVQFGSCFYCDHIVLYSARLVLNEKGGSLYLSEIPFPVLPNVCKQPNLLL